MKTTRNMDRALYLKAHSEFESILRSRDATTQQRRDALDARDELDRRFRTRAANNLAERTERMRLFVSLLTDLVNGIEEQGRPLDAIDRLREIVEQAADILRTGEQDTNG